MGSSSRHGYNQSMSLLLAVVVAVSVVSGCRGGSKVHTYDDIARNLLKNIRGSTGTVDEAAVARKIELELKPFDSRVADGDRTDFRRDACHVKDMYEARQIDSMDEAV